ncbi:TrkH family potassium uptake protein [Aureibaculum marinum]|uniref:TrkH family potassium uptake protein n=1 Tax=Aureibaculum marinum TaxID=2487930 RepID=A0A3N4P5J0_9FLAO|nr:potassium transporter TrkG [Aureibaculum marinum]RPE00147.1 TrkH family potassium uptake protein [Aureibaculum marinum]
MKNLNIKIIFQMMGFLLIFNGLFMLISALISYIYKDGATQGIFFAGIITILAGVISRFTTKNFKKKINKQEGYIIVTLGWVLMSLSGSLPYLFSESIPSFTDAFFETISGYTTTGASILDDIESMPAGILFWRSTTHWIGGMGIIVLTIAVLPLLGIGGMQLFAAEAPGPSADKLHPRITDTAKRLYLIYLGLTIAEAILLKLAGMSVFDAVNHAMSTLSTGGFSTKNASVAYWNDQPAIQYIITIFMILAGTNFVLSYFAFKGQFSKIYKDEEFKTYFLNILGISIIVGLIVYFRADVSQVATDTQLIAHPMVNGQFESALRHSFFQVASVITTTGFVSADFTIWTPFLTTLFFILMFFGASAGSTSGGVKFVRHIIMIKNGFIEFKRSMHPSAIIPVRYNEKAVSQDIVFNIMAFFILYLILFVLGALVFGIMGLDFVTSVGGSASSLGNVGPAFGQLSPVNNFNSLPAIGKWWAAFLMLLGRLELFTVLILFTPYFWRSGKF